MLIARTPFRQLARLYAAILSASESLSKLSDNAIRDQPAAGSDLRSQLDANSRDLQSMAQRVVRLENLVKHLRLQNSNNPTCPFLIEGRVEGLTPFPFEIHRAGDEFISTQLEETGSWEPLETDVVRRLCQPGDFVLDIGSNIGWYSVIASKVIGRTGRLVAFEPDPDNFAILSRNIERILDGAQASLHHAAVSDTEGTLKLFLSAGNRGDHRIFDDGTQRDSIEVQTLTLDVLLAGEHRLPDLVKSDTQGSEARILRGAGATLARGWRPVFVIEFWPFGLCGSGDDPMKLWKELSDLGYQMFELTEQQLQLLPLDEERLRLGMTTSMSTASEGFINIVALPNGSNRLAAIEHLIAK